MGISARHLMKEKISVGPNATARDVAMKIISSGLAGMPVVDDDQKLVGIVSENVILDAISEDQDLDAVKASEVMIPPPIVADACTDPKELIKLLLHSSCSVVTVVKDGKYVGVVSRHMLMDIFTSPNYDRFASRDRKAPFQCL